jgi:ABC-type sugar transport system substrate-binding protein
MRLKGVLLVTVALMVASVGSVATAEEGADLTGKRVLVVPYWLDQFNTANTSWIARLLEEKGIESDIINPDKQAARQLDIIETAIASGNYDAIAWQPIDETLAVSTIEKIQDAGLGQVVSFSSLQPGTDGLNFSGATVGWTETYFDSGVAAAEFLLEHPELGPPRIAYSNIFPPEQKCDDLLVSLVEGVKSVIPDDVEVVYDGGAVSQAESNSKMTDFIARGIPFNIAAGCGTTFDMGGYEAIKAEGLAAAMPGEMGSADKVPAQVFITSLDASPPELEALWAPDESMMRSVMFGPKSAAEAVVTLLEAQLSGAVAPDESAEAVAALITLDSDCEAGRAAVMEQFEGVEGFELPECG